MATETRTGGRSATQAVIGGGLAIAVGRPQLPTPRGFSWRPLAEVARLETGHTPSRRQPAYWGGDIPWIGIRDATRNHGRTISSTVQYVTQAGIDNSSARVLPSGTVCLSRTASVGYVVVMGIPMATSQDFVNWVCGPELDPKYLKYALQADREALLRFANGSTHQTIYFPEVKAFHILVPTLAEQRAIAATLGALDDKIESNRRLLQTVNALVDAMAEHSSADVPLVALKALAALNRSTANPASLAGSHVDHFSLPAFDASAMPEVTDAATIKSNKIELCGPSVLISRLNPRIERYWWVNPGDKPALASTEFACLTSSDPESLAGVWLAVRSPAFRNELPKRVTGTSGSHQRVRPHDLMSMPVPDARAIAIEMKARTLTLLQLAESRRQESAALAALRDALLPELLSGRIRVPEAAEAVQEAVG